MKRGFDFARAYRLVLSPDCGLAPLRKLVLIAIVASNWRGTDVARASVRWIASRTGLHRTCVADHMRALPGDPALPFVLEVLPRRKRCDSQHFRIILPAKSCQSTGATRVSPRMPQSCQSTADRVSVHGCHACQSTADDPITSPTTGRKEVIRQATPLGATPPGYACPWHPNETHYAIRADLSRADVDHHAELFQRRRAERGYSDDPDVAFAKWLASPRCRPAPAPAAPRQAPGRPRKRLNQPAPSAACRPAVEILVGAREDDPHE